MQMHMKIERTTSPMNKRDRPRFDLHLVVPSDPARLAVPSAQLLEEHPRRQRQHRRIGREHVPERVQNAQHPLPQPHVRQHPIAHCRCGLGHPPPAARRAHAAPFARERHQHVVAAPATSRPAEAMGQHSAAQIPVELLDDVPRQRPSRAFCGEREEGLQVLRDERVQRGLRRVVAHVRARGGGSRGHERASPERTRCKPSLHWESAGNHGVTLRWYGPPRRAALRGPHV